MRNVSGKNATPAAELKEFAKSKELKIDATAANIEVLAASLMVLFFSFKFIYLTQ